MKNLVGIIILALTIFSCGKPKQALYKNPEAPVEKRVDDLIKRMTLEEKVSQLFSIRITDSLAWDHEGNFVGTGDTARLNIGVGSFWSGAFFRKDAESRVKCLNGIQYYLIEKSRLGIPAFVFAEGLHGFMADGATSFPQAIALGSTWDTALIEQVYTITALEASSSGVTQFLSPVVDLARDPRWGRTEECFGEDAYLVSRIGLAAVYGFQGRDKMIGPDHAAVTLKHFAGHGQPEGGRNIAPVNYSDREFRENHLYPFEIAVKKGHAQSIMASYNEWDGVPNHINHKLLTEILRDEWKFDGYVMSDGGGLDVTWREHLAAKDSAEAGILSILAGVDYDLGGSGCFNAMAEQIRKGLVSEEVLNKAVRNILRVKFVSGIFDHPYADVVHMKKLMNCPDHQQLALKAAHEAMILLKNDNGLLPLDSNKIKKLAVIGPNAADIHLGGYSAIPMKGVSILKGLKDFAGNRMEILYAEGCKITVNKQVDWKVEESPIPASAETDAKLIAEAVRTAKQCDAVLLILGENELVNREAWNVKHLGDADQLNLYGRQEELAKAILTTGKPVVVILINGRPLSINYLAENAPAILEGWYLGEETGHAVADVVFGKVNPSGKLTVTVPRNVGQLPCFYNHKPSRFREYVSSNSDPLFPFGFGLSYTQFDYTSLVLSKSKITPAESVVVSIDVTNTGPYTGDEIVQLYIHDLISVPVRPVMELQDFSRITLIPGETKTVNFKLTPDKLESIGMDMHRMIQPGDFAIMVGRSSVEFLSDTLTVINP
jgi:beta-glucosidase